MTPRAFDSKDVQRLFDHADDAAVACIIRTCKAGLDVRRVLADGAQLDLLFDLDNGVGEGLRLLCGRSQDVVSQPLGALRADAGQAVQLLDQASAARAFWVAAADLGR